MKSWHGRSGLVAKPGAVPLLLLLALGAGAPLVGCASDSLENGDVEQVGVLGFNLEVAPGVTLSSVSYTITGNGFTKTGTIDVGNSPTISGTIGGIPAGNGYTIALAATSVEEGTSFTGSATFGVTAGETTSVSIILSSVSESNNGNLVVNGTIGVGPVVHELTATPLEVFVGGEVTLEGVATDPVAGPSPLSYSWSTTGGLIDNPLAANATLSSDAPGTFTVQLTVSDGELSDTKSITVEFVQRAVERPNILLLLIDDLGAEGTSVYPQLVGNSGQVPVPNIEALAEDGLVFDNAWASPVCSPTRGTIISGLYGYRTGVTNVGNVLPTSTVTLFDRLTAESPSYEHAFFGKYHVGGGNIDPQPGGSFAQAPTILQHVRDLGITSFRGILGGGVASYFNWTAYDINQPNVATTTYATTALTNFAIDFIHEHEAQKPDEPWFVYQAYNAPHAANGGNNPYQVPPRELHSVSIPNDPNPGTTGTTIPIYKANIQSLDTEIGRLLAEVDLEKTVVIFVGDNGTPPPVKDTGAKLRDSKGSVYEGGVRVPLIVAGAGVTRRGREDDLFVTTDIYASILELAGVSVSQVNNSYSFKPLLTDETATNGRTHSFTEVSTGTSSRRYAVKDKRYKLIYNAGTRELYDLVADPLETTNRYNNAAYADARASLEAEVATLRAAGPSYFP